MADERYRIEPMGEPGEHGVRVPHPISCRPVAVVGSTRLGLSAGGGTLCRGYLEGYSR